MSVTSLSCIRRFQYVNWIRVRVSRSCRPKRFQSNAFDGMHYVLIDEKGDCIHAIVDEHDYTHTAKMKDGCLYDIFHVHVKTNSGGYKVVDNDVEVGFNEMSNIVPLQQGACLIPKYICHFLSFNDIERCFNEQQKLDTEKKRVLLADMYGCIRKVAPVRSIFISARNEQESICEIFLENHRRENVKVTLWSDLAKHFDVDAINESTNPTFAIFTSLRMKMIRGEITPTGTNHTCVIFNPDVPQKIDFLAEFSKPGDKTRIGRGHSIEKKS